MSPEVLPAQLTPEQITKGAAAALALVAALYLGFKGRARWEPHDQDVPRGSQRLGSLAACVFIVLIAFFLGTPAFARELAIITVICLGIAIASYVAYQSLTTTHIYTIEKIIKRKSNRINILGGSELQPKAVEQIQRGTPFKLWSMDVEAI